jgi:hypothetical protein
MDLGEYLNAFQSTGIIFSVIVAVIILGSLCGVIALVIGVP